MWEIARVVGEKLVVPQLKLAESKLSFFAIDVAFMFGCGLFLKRHFLFFDKKQTEG